MTVVPSWGAAAILAIVQGLTEFLPVSSSGHLAAAQQIWPSLQFPGVTLEVAVHVGTSIAVLVYYRCLFHELVFTGTKEVEGLTSAQWAGYIALGSIPIAIIGLTLEDTIRAAFDSLHAVAAALVITGVVLMSTKLRALRQAQLTAGIAFAIGVIQAGAIFPGVSRSGVTISLALLLGVAHRQAVIFSFLLSIPAIMGAALLDALDLLEGPFPPGILFAKIGFATLCAGAIGYVCIGLVHRATERQWWHHFAWYCWFLAAVLAMLARGA